MLLLDEVLAELDAQRRADLLGRLSECEQAMLTTTDLDLFSPGFVTRLGLLADQGGAGGDHPMRSTTDAYLSDQYFAWGVPKLPRPAERNSIPRPGRR